MKKLFIFGDVHLSAINRWNFDAGNNFINWFKNENFGNKADNEVVFVGDIAERDTNPGDVIEQMDRLFSIASEKFSHVYICMGNHDTKKYHDVQQHSLKFLNNKENTDVIENEAEIITKNEFDMLVLPWKRVDNMTLADYYNTKLPKEMYTKNYDVMIGHWNIKEDKGMEWMREGVDIKLFNPKNFAIGHIHTRPRNEYIGSIFPNNISEQVPNQSRGYKVIDETKKESYVTMPNFLEYVTIKLGDPVPAQRDNCAYAYIISDCDSIAQAEEKYPGLNIRNIERKETALNANAELTADKNSTNITTFIGKPTVALDEMIKENDMHLSRKTYNLVKTMLEEKEKEIVA